MKPHSSSLFCCPSSIRFTEWSIAPAAGAVRNSLRKKAVLSLAVWAIAFSGLFALGQSVQAADPATPAAAAATPAAPNKGPAPGHSVHGEAFDEGPRQKAELLPGTGNIVFPCSSSSEPTRQFVLQGVGQLHGFWFYEAERSFRQALVTDRDCAIAYWGLAMANKNNASRARKFIAEAVTRQEKASPREKLYIEGLSAYLKEPADKEKVDKKEDEKKRRQALIKSYEKILGEFPEDLEAKALLGLLIWESKDQLPISSFFAVESLLKEVTRENPLHPCHHYLIHLWDAEQASRALPSADKCGEAAPAIAHMWHMPGHTYSKVKRYHDAAWQQEASARVDHFHMQRTRILPDQIHNFAHNNEWLIRNLIQIGRPQEAVRLARNMIEIPRHPKLNTLAKDGTAKYGRERLLDVLSQCEMWSDLIALADSPYLPSLNDQSNDELRRLRLLGRACYETGRIEQGGEILGQVTHGLEKLRREQATVMSRAADEAIAAKKTGEEIRKAIDAARNREQSRLQRWEQAVWELCALAQRSSGDLAAAKASLEQAGEVEKTLKAELLLALEEKDSALKLYQEHVDQNQEEVLPLAHWTWGLWKSGKVDEAKQKFEKLRALSEGVDLTTPAIARLAPLALEYQWPVDWRQPLKARPHFGSRPSLDTLGSPVWEPVLARGWQLPDRTQTVHNFDRWRGKPLVVIFSLGSGCLHCNDQLKAIAKQYPQWQALGIEVVAITTDDPPTIERAMANYGQSFPISLLSAAGTNAFHDYGCHDDFENQALHGTFLIDARGRIRWQDIGAEPFMEFDFLQTEAKRLLSFLPAESAPQTAAKSGEPTSDAGSE